MAIEPRTGADMKLFHRFMSKVSVSDGCWDWTAFRNHDGYGMFGVGRKAVSAHRVAFLLFNGDIPAGLCVLHTCDRPACVNPQHLYVGTQLQNIRDRVERGRSRAPIGEEHGMAKLTRADVEMIRAEIAAGCVQERLAERYGVTPTTISAIKVRRLWR